MPWQVLFLILLYQVYINGWMYPVNTISAKIGRYHSDSWALQLNRIYFSSEECTEERRAHDVENQDPTSPPVLRVALSKDDYRTMHIQKILKADVGDALKVLTLTLTLTLTPTLTITITITITLTLTITLTMPLTLILTLTLTKVGVLEVGGTDRGVLEKSCREEGVEITLGPRYALEGNSRSNVDLILAVPRPLRLERLLPVISMIGVGRLVLIDAEKVVLTVPYV